MKIDLKHLMTEVEVDSFAPVDFTKEIGNTLHRLAMTIPMADLARKIFYSEGEIEISKEEYDEFLSIVKRSYPIAVWSAIEKQVTGNE